MDLRRARLTLVRRGWTVEAGPKCPVSRWTTTHTRPREQRPHRSQRETAPRDDGEPPSRPTVYTFGVEARERWGLA